MEIRRNYLTWHDYPIIVSLARWHFHCRDSKERKNRLWLLWLYFLKRGFEPHSTKVIPGSANQRCIRPCGDGLTDNSDLGMSRCSSAVRAHHHQPPQGGKTTTAWEKNPPACNPFFCCALAAEMCQRALAWRCRDVGVRLCCYFWCLALASEQPHNTTIIRKAVAASAQASGGSASRQSFHNWTLPH